MRYLEIDSNEYRQCMNEVDVTERNIEICMCGVTSDIWTSMTQAQNITVYSCKENCSTFKHLSSCDILSRDRVHLKHLQM